MNLDYQEPKLNLKAKRLFNYYSLGIIDDSHECANQIQDVLTKIQDEYVAPLKRGRPPTKIKNILQNKTQTDYQKFVKENFTLVYDQNKHLSTQDIMNKLSIIWKEKQIQIIV